MSTVAKIPSAPSPTPAAMPKAPLRVVASASGAVSVSGVNHSYNVLGGVTKALEDIDVEIAPGRFVVIVGPSGCGKSSLLMMMTGLLKPTAGTIICSGRPMVSPDPDVVGVVFQEASLYPWLTAQDNVEFPLSLRGVPKAERAKRAREKLALVGLTGFEARYPHELSGGMKQRVSIARGLVQNPPILMLDEPFAALDEQTRITMGDELLRIWAETGKTVVFVTHSLSEAAYLADEIIVMSARPGKIIDRIEVTLPRPRTYEMMSTTQFAELREQIWKQIRHQAAE
jgi:NitT/TauT family transport system ATP-binding protein